VSGPGFSQARKQATGASGVHTPGGLYDEEPRYASNTERLLERLLAESVNEIARAEYADAPEAHLEQHERAAERARERAGSQFDSQLQSSTPSLPVSVPAPPPPPRLTAVSRASAVDPSRFTVTALHPDLAEPVQPVAHNTDHAEALGSCVAVAAAVAAVGGAGVTPAVQYAAAAAGGFNGTWVYRNGAADNSHYSHMAMVERLPPSSRHAFIAVWQAADQVSEPGPRYGVGLGCSRASSAA